MDALTSENATNAHSELISTRGSNRAPAAIGAASTRMFFTHCLGRIARSQAGSGEGLG